MCEYKVTYIDKDNNTEDCVGVFKSLDEAVKRAYYYLEDELDGDFDGDDYDDITNALSTRYFYVCGYGDSSIEIEEIN